jgi:membrane protein YqaA with SNARE-associated domain
MSPLLRLYDRVLSWARHPHAAWYLAGLSFAEASFFPVPPDAMLAPMALARPERAIRYGAIATAASAFGGVFGYLIGAFALHLVEPWLLSGPYAEAYHQARQWFDEWGVWVVFIAGFSPVPYKVFTITAGAASMAFIPFVIASVVGRGARFFLVAGLIYWGGARIERFLRTYIDMVGWGALALAVVLYLLLR